MFDLAALIRVDSRSTSIRRWLAPGLTILPTSAYLLLQCKLLLPLQKLKHALTLHAEYHYISPFLGILLHPHAVDAAIDHTPLRTVVRVDGFGVVPDEAVHNDYIKIRIGPKIQSYV